jgi:Rieske Fe-S protein
MTRREFLILAAAATAGCRSVTDHGNPAITHERVVNAGPIANYAADGVYRNFRDTGFFVIRQGDKLFALSAICTHKRCKLIAEKSRSFYCPCHGSTFDPNGHVTQGPAKRDLSILKTVISEKSELVVTVPGV